MSLYNKQSDLFFPTFLIDCTSLSSDPKFKCTGGGGEFVDQNILVTCNPYKTTGKCAEFKKGESCSACISHMYYVRLD